MQTAAYSQLLVGFLKVVSDTRFGNDIPGQRSVRLYLLAQVRNIDSDIVQVIGIFPAPHPLLVQRYILTLSQFKRIQLVNS